MIHNAMNLGRDTLQIIGDDTDKTKSNSSLATPCVCKNHLNNVNKGGKMLVTWPQKQPLSYITDLSTLRIHSNYFLFVTVAKFMLNYVSFEL